MIWIPETCTSTWNKGATAKSAKGIMTATKKQGGETVDIPRGAGGTLVSSMLCSI